MNISTLTALSGVNFHDSTFTSVPFLQLEHNQDWSEQLLPNASVILQPGLGNIIPRALFFPSLH
jgi:hypothetical protein